MWDGCCAVACVAELSPSHDPGASFDVHSSKTTDERWLCGAFLDTVQKPRPGHVLVNGLYTGVS